MIEAPANLSATRSLLPRKAALAAPILAPLDAMDIGIWEPDTVLQGLAFVPLGAAALVAAGWISEGMAAMSRALARWGVR